MQMLRTRMVVGRRNNHLAQTNLGYKLQSGANIHASAVHHQTSTRFSQSLYQPALHGQDLARTSPDVNQISQNVSNLELVIVRCQCYTRSGQDATRSGTRKFMNTVDFQSKPEALRHYQIWDQQLSTPRKLTISVKHYTCLQVKSLLTKF